MKKELDVLALCNVLKDIVIQVHDEELEALGLTKGVMHLMSEEQQQRILNYFAAREKTYEMGGSGPNMIRTLAALGLKVSQAGMVGNDRNGELYLQRMQELGIHNNILQSPMGSTGTSIVLISPDGERTMNTCLGMSRCYTTHDIPEADIARSAFLVVTGYQWDTPNQIEAVNHAIRVAKHHHTRIVLDLSDPLCVERHRETFINILEEYVDVVFSNLKEARMLTGQQDIQSNLNALAALVNIAVLKCGAQGAWIQHGQEKIFIPANPVQVVDTTAAGDMFAGGFLSGLVRGCSLEEAGHLAAFCAETVIQVIGARIPENLRELSEHYLANLRKTKALKAVS